MSEWLTPDELLEQWRVAVELDIPHASIRIGDGEACIAAHEEILTMNFIRETYNWINNINYCGVTLPNMDARIRLIAALKQADFIGILHQLNWWGWRPLSDMVIKYYDIQPEKIFYAFDNVNISKMPRFYDTFKNTRILLVGNKARKYKEVLERRYEWKRIVGTVECQNWTMVDAAINKMDHYDYQLAIVSAGVPAKVLAAHAKLTGHVGIDFGQGTDGCIVADMKGLNTWEDTRYKAP